MLRWMLFSMSFIKSPFGFRGRRCLIAEPGLGGDLDGRGNTRVSTALGSCFGEVGGLG
jgi:hypothetical protein